MTSLSASSTVLFQSLGRDSVGLDLRDVPDHVRVDLSFNPSVGILLVWTTGW